jgi:hypothetical protein
MDVIQSASDPKAGAASAASPALKCARHYYPDRRDGSAYGTERTFGEPMAMPASDPYPPRLSLRKRTLNAAWLNNGAARDSDSRLSP